MDYIIIPIAIRVTGIKVDAKHSRRFLYSSAPLFIYLCSSLLHPHVYTCTYTPALMYAPWILHTKGPFARGMSPDQRHDRLNLALANYTLDTVPRCPSLLVAGLSSYFSCSLLCILRTRGSAQSAEPAARGRLQIARITRALAVTYAYDTYWNAPPFHSRAFKNKC